MSILKNLIRVLDKISDKTGTIVSWLTTVLVLVVCYDVFTRYLLQKSSIAVQELEWHLFAIIFLLGAAYTLKRDRHVRVDILYLKFKPKTRAWVDLLGGIFLLIPFCILVIVASHKFILNSFLIKEISPDPGGLPARYLLKACIPFGFILVLLQSFSQTAKSLLAVMRGDETSTYSESEQHS